MEPNSLPSAAVDEDAAAQAGRLLAAPPAAPMDLARLEGLGRRMALAWVGLYTALIVLVSLAPFDRWDCSAFHLGWQWRILQDSLVVRARLHVLRDVVTNVLLYLPLGLLVPWAALRPRGVVTADDPSAARAARVAPATAWLGFGLSLAMELAQFPTSRYPNYFDLASNGGGYLFGWLLMRGVVLHYGLSPAMLLGRRLATPRARIAAALRMVYVTLLVVLSLLPFNVAVGAELLWAKLRGESSGHLWLDPLAPWSPERLGMLLRVGLLVVPYGFFSRLAHPERGRRALARYALLGGAVQALIELAQIPVLDRTSDLMQVFAAGVGAGLGVLLAAGWDRATLSVAPGDGPSPDAASAGRWFQFRDALFLALLGWLLVLLVDSWRPFRFVPMAWDAARKLYREADWVPFHIYLTQERSLAIWKDLGREIGLWVPLGLLLAAWLGRVAQGWNSRRRWIAALVLVVGWGVLLELGQAMIVERTVDATDILSHALGGALGYLLGLLLPVPRGSNGAGGQIRCGSGDAR